MKSFKDWALEVIDQYVNTMELTTQLFYQEYINRMGNELQKDFLEQYLWSCSKNSIKDMRRDLAYPINHLMDEDSKEGLDSLLTEAVNEMEGVVEEDES